MNKRSFEDFKKTNFHLSEEKKMLDSFQKEQKQELDTACTCDRTSEGCVFVNAHIYIHCVPTLFV